METPGVDENKFKFFRTKTEDATVLAPPQPILQSTHHMSVPALALPVEGKPFLLAKIELRKFNGDVRKWFQFCRQFKKIHDGTVEKEDTLQYLIQSLGFDRQ